MSYVIQDNTGTPSGYKPNYWGGHPNEHGLKARHWQQDIKNAVHYPTYLEAETILKKYWITHYNQPNRTPGTSVIILKVDDDTNEAPSSPPSKTCISCSEPNLYDFPHGWQCVGCKLWKHLAR